MNVCHATLRIPGWLVLLSLSACIYFLTISQSVIQSTGDTEGQYLVPGNKTVSETIKDHEVSGEIIKQSWYWPDYNERLRVSAEGTSCYFFFF